jgi:hypothetical protein
VPWPSLWGLTFLLLGLQPQQFPPLTTNPSTHPPVERRLPIDQPGVVTPRSKHRRIDETQLMRNANELAKLGDEIPSLVEQAKKGLLPKDLNQRLKRIEKLSKQLRGELTQ